MKKSNTQEKSPFDENGFILTDKVAISYIEQRFKEENLSLATLSKDGNERATENVGAVTTSDGVTRNLIFQGAADLVITDGKRTLLITRGTLPGIGKLAIPGGLKDKGESVSQTAKREGKEEANVDLTPTHSEKALEMTPIATDIRVFKQQKGTSEEDFLKFCDSRGAKPGDLMVIGTAVTLEIISEEAFDQIIEKNKGVDFNDKSAGENWQNVVLDFDDIAKGQHKDTGKPIEFSFEHHRLILVQIAKRLNELKNEKPELFKKDLSKLSKTSVTPRTGDNKPKKDTQQSTEKNRARGVGI